MQVSHPRHYRFTISVSKSSSFSFLPNRNVVVKIARLYTKLQETRFTLHHAPNKNPQWNDSIPPKSIATPSAFVAFVHFSNFLYVPFAESFSLTQLNSRTGLEYFANKTQKVASFLHPQQHNANVDFFFIKYFLIINNKNYNFFSKSLNKKRINYKFKNK